MLPPVSFCISNGGHYARLLEVDNFSIGFGKVVAGVIDVQQVVNHFALRH